MPEKTLKERETAFGTEVKKFREQYPLQMLTDFYYYWTESNKSKTKMKFEMEKTWDISRRLRTWERNQQNWNKNGINSKNGKDSLNRPAITGTASGAGTF